MGVECPYLALCSRETTITPDKRTAATKVLTQAIGGEGIISRKCEWSGTSWEPTGNNNSYVIPWDDIYPSPSVCEGIPIREGRIYFKGMHPAEGQIGGMLTEDGADLLNLAVDERNHCVRFMHFASASNRVEIEFSEA